MSTEEAHEWLAGKRSNINTFIDSTDSRGGDLAMCAIADARRHLACTRRSPGA